MLDVVVGRRGAFGGTWRALNEGVVEKHEAGHTVRLLVQHRRRAVHVVRRRRPDRRHADRLDGVLAVGARAGGVAQPCGRCC